MVCHPCNVLETYKLLYPGGACYHYSHHCRIAGGNIAHTPVTPLQTPTIKDKGDAIHSVLMQIKTILWLLSLTCDDFDELIKHLNIIQSVPASVYYTPCKGLPSV